MGRKLTEDEKAQRQAIRQRIGAELQSIGERIALVEDDQTIMTPVLSMPSARTPR
jgi:hypothetical protein